MATQLLGEARCAAVLGDGRAVSFLVVFHSTHVCFNRDFHQDRHRLLSDTFLSSIRMIAGFPPWCLCSLCGQICLVALNGFASARV